MKNNLKYLIAGLLLISFIIFLVISLNRPNSNNIPQDPLADQLNNCQKIISSYIGLSEQSATDRANNENHPFRIVMRDNVSFPLTADYSPSRLNFEINGDSVTKANCG